MLVPIRLIGRQTRSDAVSCTCCKFVQTLDTLVSRRRVGDHNSGKAARRCVHGGSRSVLGDGIDHRHYRRHDDRGAGTDVSISTLARLLASPSPDVRQPRYHGMSIASFKVRLRACNNLRRVASSRSPTTILSLSMDSSTASKWQFFASRRISPR